jgi:hypothetical protein
MDPLGKLLRRVRRRLLAVRAAEAGLAGALVGAGAALVQTLLRIFWPRALPAGWAEPLWPLVWPAAGFAAAFLARLFVGASLRQAALAADRAGRLKERLATALEVLDAAAESPGHALDAHLLEQARSVAERLAVPNSSLAKSLGQRGRMVLAAILVLASLSFVPSVAGPPLAAPAASRAADALTRAARDERIAPDLRQAVERSVGRLLEAGARRRDAEEATQEVRQAAAQAAERRRAAGEALQKIENPQVKKMVEAASAGDGAGAGAAAGELANRLRGEPGKPALSNAEGTGMPPVERERLADALQGAAPAAAEANFARLAAELQAAADAVRQSKGDAAETLGRLAAAITEAFGDPSRQGAEGVLAALEQARRALGLAEVPSPAEGAAVAGAARPSEAQTAGASAVPAEGGAGTAAGLPVPPEVRPEDRDVVQRYFGG